MIINRYDNKEVCIKTEWLEPYVKEKEKYLQRSRGVFSPPSFSSFFLLLLFPPSFHFWWVAFVLLGERNTNHTAAVFLESWGVLVQPILHLVSSCCLRVVLEKVDSLLQEKRLYFIFQIISAALAHISCDLANFWRVFRKLTKASLSEQAGAITVALRM